MLKRAIKSALEQTVECEIIVVDDCSTDGTKKYVQSLGSRVIYYCTDSNQGHAGTMNVGVQNADGDWVKPVDDDDYLAPNCIEEMTKAINLHPQAAILSCQAAQVVIVDARYYSGRLYFRTGRETFTSSGSWLV